MTTSESRETVQSLVSLVSDVLAAVAERDLYLAQAAGGRADLAATPAATLAARMDVRTVARSREPAAEQARARAWTAHQAAMDAFARAGVLPPPGVSIGAPNAKDATCWQTWLDSL